MQPTKMVHFLFIKIDFRFGDKFPPFAVYNEPSDRVLSWACARCMYKLWVIFSANASSRRALTHVCYLRFTLRSHRTIFLRHRFDIVNFRYRKIEKGTRATRKKPGAAFFRQTARVSWKHLIDLWCICSMQQQHIVSVRVSSILRVSTFSITQKTGQTKSEPMTSSDCWRASDSGAHFRLTRDPIDVAGGIFLWLPVTCRMRSRSWQFIYIKRQSPAPSIWKIVFANATDTDVSRFGARFSFSVEWIDDPLLLLPLLRATESVNCVRDENQQNTKRLNLCGRFFVQRYIRR